MDACATEMVCPPPSIAWSALILWTITLYGVITILSAFAGFIQLHSPTRIGRRIVGIFMIVDLVGAAVAPVLIYGLFDARVIALLVVGTLLLLAILGRAARAKPLNGTLPTARVHQSPDQSRA